MKTPVNLREMGFLKIAILLFSIQAPFTLADNRNPKTIVLDAGHQPSNGGASAVCDEKEYTYNDEIVAEIKKALIEYQIILTRKPNEEVAPQDPKLIEYLPDAEKPKFEKAKSLYSRAAIANQIKADFFISIHHDSVNESKQLKDTNLCQGKGGRRIVDDFRKKHHFGFNIFINKDAESGIYKKSLSMAGLLARSLKKLGRIPSDYHQFPDDDCKSCSPIDADLGIWHHDLALLRSARMPALLLEVGVIVDPEDEKTVSDPKFRNKLGEIFKNAFNEYFK